MVSKFGMRQNRDNFTTMESDDEMVEVGKMAGKTGIGTSKRSGAPFENSQDM